MNCTHPQEHLWDYHTRAERSSSMKHIKYAEAYQRVFPAVSDSLV
jgi:hypothetical protein